MAGFEVSSQTFGASPSLPKRHSARYLYPCAAVASQVVQGTISAPLSGIMGMAFSTIASSRATPFWETLVNDQGTLDEPLMAFQLTRFIDTQGAQGLEPVARSRSELPTRLCSPAISTSSRYRTGKKGSGSKSSLVCFASLWYLGHLI